MTHTLTRRAVLARFAATGAAALAAPLLAPISALAGRDPFWRLDASAQAELVRRGEVSALELVDAAITRIEALNPTLNAVVTTQFERARATARARVPEGPFRGVPYLIKDLNDLAGVRTTHGSRMFAERIAERSAPYVQRTLDTGVIPLGKSNTPEFGGLATTESVLLGPCRNPWDPAHTPGGSSGGAAAAVAAGLVPFAHANDGGGSIRIPASCCGLFGLKPGRGRLEPGDDLRGADIGAELCVSRSVRDSAAMLAATEYRPRRNRGNASSRSGSASSRSGSASSRSGSGLPTATFPPVGFITHPDKRRLRIAFSTRTYTGAAPHPEVEAAAQRAAALTGDLGHHVEEAAPGIDGERFFEAFMTVWSSGAAARVAEAESRGLDPKEVLEPWTLGLAELHRRQPDDTMAAALQNFNQMERIYRAFFSRYDVVLTPTLAAPPVLVGEQAPTVEFATLYERVHDWVAYTPIHNATGNAAMSVPLGWSHGGLPIGLQYAAPRGGEGTLLALAYELEEAAPWHDRWPALASGGETGGRDDPRGDVS